MNAASVGRRLAAAVFIAVLAGSAGAQLASSPGQTALPDGSAHRFEADMDAGMARMMQDMHALDYSGNADIDFLAMMIAHHAGAVDMARLVLRHGRDPATRHLAEDIIAGQSLEIESMTRRLVALHEPASSRAGPEFPLLGGNRGN